MSNRKAWLLFIVILLSTIFLVARWAWIPEDLQLTDCTLNKNAAWIAVDWSSKPVNELAVRELADVLASKQIKYVFPYTTFLKSDGSFSQSYQYALQFVSTLRHFNPNISILAWIGIPLKNERPIGIKGAVDLTDQATRKKIIEFVAALMKDGQYDGIHLDVETVLNNDPTFLLLIDEVRTAIRTDQTISVASSHWVPDSLNALPLIKDFRWTSEYYRSVAKRVDQIVTMTYDSYAPASAIYRFWMREQSNSIAYGLKESNVELLTGISVSREETLAHHPNVETLKDGLTGLCANRQKSRAIDGVALYADWDFTPADWAIWNEWQK